MKMAQEFREFISRGNVIDLAVGVIIGAAFGKIVNSLVAEVIMPPIGALMKGVDFSSLFVSLDGSITKPSPPPNKLVRRSSATEFFLTP